MRRGRTWPWTRMRPFLARFSEPVWSGHLPSWADFITTTPVFRFSVHTAGAVTGAKGPEVVTMLPSAYTIVMDVISMVIAVN